MLQSESFLHPLSCNPACKFSCTATTACYLADTKRHSNWTVRVVAQPSHTKPKPIQAIPSSDSECPEFYLVALRLTGGGRQSSPGEPCSSPWVLGCSAGHCKLVGQAINQRACDALSSVSFLSAMQSRGVGNLNKSANGKPENYSIYQIAGRVVRCGPDVEYNHTLTLSHPVCKWCLIEFRLSSSSHFLWPPLTPQYPAPPAAAVFLFETHKLCPCFYSCWRRGGRAKVLASW